MAPKKKRRTVASSDTVSWLSHPTRLFGQPDKCKENNKHINPNDGLNQYNYSNENSSQNSTGEHEDVVTNNGYHMFKDKKHVAKRVAISENGTCSKMEKTSDDIPPESNDSKDGDNRDQSGNVDKIKTKNSDKMKCLDFIQNVANKLKKEDDIFCKTIMKIRDLDKMQDSEVKTLKYDLINILLSLLLDSNEDDLRVIEETLKDMIIPESLKRFVVHNNCITLHPVYLGQGFTSIVHSGVLSKDGLRTEVALKKPKESRAKFFEKMIINEATVLSQLDHKNIIKMLAYKKNGPEIALELMELGSLNQAIQRGQFCDRDLMKVLIDIATGMEFLHGKQYLHRDLACRNVFVGATKECKIGDFGQSVYVGDSNGEYQDTGANRLCGKPVSPESLESRTFRFQTDVWAMGMLILDMYLHLSSDMMDQFFYNIMAVGFMEDQIKMTKPRGCSDALFQYATNHLLNRNYKKRPTFSAIRETMENYYKKKIELLYFT